MTNSALDWFCQLLISNVRDESIEIWKLITDGRMKGERASKIRQQLQNFSEDGRDLFTALIPEIVDSVLHNLPVMLEQDNGVSVSIDTDEISAPSLKDVSDCLSGELYSDRGWSSRFSKT